MKKRFISLIFIFALVILGFTGLFYFYAKKEVTQESKAEQIVDLNEIEQLALDGQKQKMIEKIDVLQEELRAESVLGGNKQILMLGGISLLLLLILGMYIWFSVLKPFHKLKDFAKQISEGDFSIPLNYEHSNYFGDFTWAFDSMRREITKARACEQEAIENNKTVIATLSHDIKTPVASIRAYAEGLEANLDTSVEKRAKYLSVMIRKCDEVAKLTNDLFIHSVADMDKLKISVEKVEICSFLKTVVSEMKGEQDDVAIRVLEKEIFVKADRNRLMQVVENLINNARKYAKTKIEIALNCDVDTVEISVRDFGNGIPNEDMPFIFHKFYRGKNCGEEQGSGLGLYIVKYVVEQMDGQVFLENHEDGLEVKIKLLRIS